MISLTQLLVQVLDTEHRLSTLQADFKLLQDSFEEMGASKATMLREHELEAEGLRTENAQLKQDLSATSRDSESMVSGLKDKLDMLQSALDQSEVELVKCEEMLKVQMA